MKKAVGRGGAGMVPRPKGEGERSLEASKFSSLGKTQRAFESSNLSPPRKTGSQAADRSGEPSPFQSPLIMEFDSSASRRLRQ
jgi:hypothetical protein